MTVPYTWTEVRLAAERCAEAAAASKLAAEALVEAEKKWALIIATEMATWPEGLFNRTLNHLCEMKGFRVE